MNAPSLLYRDDAPERPRQTDPLGVFLLFLALAAVGCAAGTQFMAWRLAFNPSLPADPSLADPGRTAVLSIVARALLCAGVSLLLAAPFLRSRLSLREAVGLALVLTGGAAVLWAFSLPLRYAPYRLGQWAYYYHASPTLAPVVYQSLGAAFGLLAALGGGLRLFAGSSRWKTSTRFGSAHWGDGSWLALGPVPVSFGGSVLGKRLAEWIARLSSGRTDEGFPLGHRPDAKAERSPLFYDRSGVHAFICAPTGGGKTVGFSIPALLMHRGSAFVVDVKRELYHVTARRRAQLGQDVYRLDPFGPETAGYNPFDLIDTAPGADTLAIDDARMIADMCVLSTGRETNPFFINAAKDLITALVLHVAYAEPRSLPPDAPGRPDANPSPRQNPARSLCALRRLLMRRDLKAVLDGISNIEEHPGAVRRYAGQFVSMNDKPFSDVVSTARQQTSFLDSPAMNRCLAQTSIRFAALKERRATVYLVLPPDRLSTYSRWLRLMITCAQKEIIRSERPAPNEPILFLIDEFPRLGKFEEIDEGVSLHRSYGIQYALIAQTMAQLKDLYGDAATNLIANPQNRILWSAAEKDAANFISDMSGDMTVAVESASKTRSRSKGRSGGSNKGISTSVQERARKLVTPGEALTLPATHCFVFARGQSPLVLRRPNYLTDPQFEGLYDPHPDHASEKEFEKARKRRIALGIEGPRAPRLPHDSARTSSASSSPSTPEEQPREGRPSDHAAGGGTAEERAAAEEGATDGDVPTASSGRTSQAPPVLAQEQLSRDEALELRQRRGLSQTL